MAQENGLRFKLVFSNWYTCNNLKFPISNGNHPAFVRYLQNIKDDNLCRTHLRSRLLDETFQQPNSGYMFRHGNFLWNFLRMHPESNMIDEDQVIDDGSIYYFPIEFEWSGMQILCQGRPFVVDEQLYYYNFKDTITPKMLSLLQAGKVKLMLTNLIDASVIQGQIKEFEDVINNMGINSNNAILAQGNVLNFVFEENPSCKIKMVQGILSLYQAANYIDRYPIYSTELNYFSDIMRPSDLNQSKLRSKKIICFNRSMNRPHRLAMAYLALKYNLLKDGIFSFVTNLDRVALFEQEFRKIYPNENVHAIINDITKLIPYEIDTQHLPNDRKQSFQTVGLGKKEWYEESYIHIVSESSFDESLNPFFSEKTWRPILNLQPFLFVGNCNSLSKLKELGFKTFHPYIDESYDSVQDSRTRFLMIEKEIKKIAEKTIEDLHDWYYSISEILIYNQNHIRSFIDYDPYEELYK